MDEITNLKLKKLKQLEDEIRLKNGLPHLYGFKDYEWSLEFIHTKNKTPIVVAANQIGKSTSQIRRMIMLATEPELWPEYWPALTKIGQKPTQFWYLYPTKDIATAEFFDKWMPILPQGEFKDHPQYGWKHYVMHKQIHYIQFNTGVRIYFKTYAQDQISLQSGTCAHIACFVDSTLVTTNNGFKNIQDVMIGDVVLTRSGYKKVLSTKTRTSEVIKVKFSNGSELIGTEDHKIYTNLGWTQLGMLTDKHECVECPVWKEKNQIVQNGLKKSKLFYLREQYIEGTLIAKTQDKEITFQSAKTENVLQSFITCIKQFGQVIIKKKKSLMDFISTILTSILLTIIHQISDLLQLKNTIPSIKLRNGRSEELEFLYATPVAQSSKQDQVEMGLGSALRNAGSLHIGNMQNVSDVIKHIREERINQIKNSAPRIVQIERLEKKEKVNCLTVEDAHEYYANGILVHNCDEEVPAHLLDELMLRISAQNGYISFVFTATQGQEFWREVVEERSKWPAAQVWQVSMYDCQRFADGTPSRWTDEAIEVVKMRCKNQAEIDRRVFGRFVVDSGKVFPTFYRSKHLIKPVPIPNSWRKIAAIDWGSGGETGHPSAIVMLAVNKEATKGYVYKCWRGDKQDTTAEDVLAKLVEMKGSDELDIVYYDYSAKDLGTIATRTGFPLVRADKDNLVGESTLNTLFKNDMLHIFDDAPDGHQANKLCNELNGILVSTPKRKRKDDLTDCLRYASIGASWDFDKIVPAYAKLKLAEAPKNQPFNRLRPGEEFIDQGKSIVNECEEEIDYWNGQYEQ